MAFEFPLGFDPQPHLNSDSLSLRPMLPTDREKLAAAARDPLIWAAHHAPNRHERSAFDPYFDVMLKVRSCLVIIDNQDKLIGCTAFYTDTNAPSRLSVGFTFLTRSHWGGATNRIVKQLTVGHVFKTASEVWFHIAPTNLRSQVATQRLGAVFTHQDEINLGGTPAPWCCYCLTKEAWDTNNRSK